MKLDVVATMPFLVKQIWTISGYLCKSVNNRRKPVAHDTKSMLFEYVSLMHGVVVEEKLSVDI
jgi:hypothetical protein